MADAARPDLPAGREALVEYALARHGAAVYRFALHQLRSPAAAEEVAQDVFVALFADGGSFDDDYHLRCWLMKVTARRCKNRWHARARRPEDATDPHDLERAAEGLALAAPAPAGPGDAADDGGAEVLWEHVDALPAPLREVVYLFYVEEYATEEIAAIVGAAPATVRTRLHRARRRLRRMLEGGPR